MPTELHKKPFIWFYGVLLTEELTNRENITSLCRYKDGWDKIHVVQNQPWPAWAERQRGTVTRFKILPISSSLSMCNFLSPSLRWFPFGWSTVRSGLYCAALGSWRQLWSCVFRARINICRQTGLKLWSLGALQNITGMLHTPFVFVTGRCRLCRL